MADYNTMRSVAGARATQIDEGLRAHMSKVYGTMSVGMLITFAVAWAVGTNAAMLSVLFTGVLRWVVVPSPSWPQLFAPTLQTVPSSLKMTVKSQPPVASRTPAMP